jgi:hypothetical protein
MLNFREDPLNFRSLGQDSRSNRKNWSSKNYPRRHFRLSVNYFTQFFVLVFVCKSFDKSRNFLFFSCKFCKYPIVSVCDRSWVRTMSDMEEAEQRLNLVEILLANIGLDA